MLTQTLSTNDSYNIFSERFVKICDRKNNILFHKQLGFRAGHSTQHALLELVDQVSNTFNEKNYLLGISIDLPKAFDTVDHKILIQKLEQYRRNEQSLPWFKNYLKIWKQYIQDDSNNNYDDIKNNNNNNNNNKNINSNFDKTELLHIICGVPQGSILGPLLFIFYINDLCFISQFLKPIVFADGTNLFCSNKEIKPLFLKADLELGKYLNGFEQINYLDKKKISLDLHFFIDPKI